jgi:hypothetical protein
MPRKLLALLLFAAGVAFAAPTWASGDFTCQVSWTLKETERSDCDNQPFLAPGNDSRVNLQLLLLDAGKISLHPAGQPKSAQDLGPTPPRTAPTAKAAVATATPPAPTNSRPRSTPAPCRPTSARPSPPPVPGSSPSAWMGRRPRRRRDRRIRARPSASRSPPI